MKFLKPHKNALDLTGQRYGYLTVLGLIELRPIIRNGKQSGNAHIWLCKCDCLREAKVSASALRRAQTRSCGCYSISLRKLRARKHGGRWLPEYGVWGDMRRRCYHTRSKQYPRYGGRGIVVCERWNDFAAFLADMGPRPSPEHTLDRIDNEGSYSPENCRWATPKQQANNRSSNRMITAFGKTQTLTQWADEMGMAKYILIHRLGYGMPVERALTQPIRKVSKRVRSHRQALERAG